MLLSLEQQNEDTIGDEGQTLILRRLGAAVGGGQAGIGGTTRGTSLIRGHTAHQGGGSEKGLQLVQKGLCTTLRLHKVSSLKLKSQERARHCHCHLSCHCHNHNTVSGILCVCILLFGAFWCAFAFEGLIVAFRELFLLCFYQNILKLLECITKK